MSRGQETAEASAEASTARGVQVERRQLPHSTGGRMIESAILTNAGGMQVHVMALGAAILSIRVPDHRGVFEDIVLGYDRTMEYMRDAPWMGVVVGRYANRIGGATFTLDGVRHHLNPNDGPNTIHGGQRGFHRAIWGLVTYFGDAGASAELDYESRAGEEGFPGTLEVRVTYTLTHANELIVDYWAATDRPTHVNLTQHSYFNLGGHDSGDVLAHELTLHASRYTLVDAARIPTGEIRSVRQSPFDFTIPRKIGDRIESPDAQLSICGGYDHNFVIDRASDAALAPAARLCEPVSRRVLEILTTEPGIQFYSGNFLAGSGPGKGGQLYRNRGGLALEPQHFPDSPNQPAFPSTVLRPGRAFRSHTVYRFSVA